MAVDSSKSGATTIADPGVPAIGNATNGARAALARRKRSSSLMQTASELPTVDHALEAFIAKANQTLVDATTWAQADQQAREAEAQRREQDAQRWKQAELQMREGEAREASLRRQLDGLQGKLAEAEARAAVAMSAASSNGLAVASEVAMADLKGQLEQSQQRLVAAEEQTKRLSADLEAARIEAMAPRSSAVSAGEPAGTSAAERIRTAEAKAVKALAAVRAAAAELTADLAAIERGHGVAPPPQKKIPWPAIAGAFIGGVALMFIVWKLALTPDDRAAPAAAQPAPAAQPTQLAPAEPAAPTGPTAQQTAPAVEPARQAAPPAAPAAATPTATPTVTPIDEAASAKPGPTVTPIDETAARPEAPKPAPRPAAPKPAKPTKPAATPPGGIIDPF